ncbi:MAG: Enoyl-CoA hydratase/isomerase [Hydrocarboniphaga sp.]|uniref:enoyl-CoA hydratase/isomerase family protein n=1 Tax=Hydrocarboniphaga sp. TaxID=2033016 RepID=UPI0026057A8C|nr:enoyl-CoA hydratase-related protein [Hydrocarboniphaga sp.]MDB5970172.1 Enoyl-CoA hydratase/isomerase [Hydrocarboniphaga sp.]
MSNDLVQVDRPIEGVVRLSLNRPEALNAFTFDMYTQLIACLRALRNDAEARVVILTGRGRGFCSGHDLRIDGHAPWIDERVGRLHYKKFFMAEVSQIPLLMRSLPQPVICAVNGPAAGVGFALALAADLLLCARSAKFINAIHNAATGHEFGLSYLLPRIVGAQRAAEILYTARPVSSDEAERIGLVLRAVDDALLMDASLELARSIIVNVPMGVWMTKQSLVFNQSAGSLEAAIEMENRAVIVSQTTADASEKMQAFFERRAPRFEQK